MSRYYGKDRIYTYVIIGDRHSITGEMEYRNGRK